MEQAKKLNMKIEPNKHYSNFAAIPHSASTDLLKKIQDTEGGVIVFGASGKMGSDISITFPRAHIKTIMQDIDKEKLEESKALALSTTAKGVSKRKIPERAWVATNKENLFSRQVVFPEKGKIPFDDIDKAYFDSTRPVTEFVSDFLNLVLGKDTAVRKDYSNVMMVLEAAPEVLEFKQNVFRFFELALSSPDAVLATNTSSLSIDEIAAKAAHPERVVGVHYFSPADRNPLLEIIAGSNTSTHVVEAMRELAIAMGKKPIVCWKDSPGAIANRILVGVVNEAAKILDDGLAPVEIIDQIFLETFYPQQITVQTKSAKTQFEAAPKLSYFKDESRLYKKINGLDTEQNKALLKGDYKLREELLEEKKKTLQEAQGRLREKVLFTQVVENLACLGSFFKPAPCVAKIKELAKGQLKIINDYLAHAERAPDFITKPVEPKLEPYKFPQPEINQTYIADRAGTIRERLMAAYITVAQEIYKEGLATVQDIEIACKEGFKYNIGPFELARHLGIDNVQLISYHVSSDNPEEPTGTSVGGEYLEINPKELSGIQSYIQDNVGFINMGRMHIQNLQMMQNSLGPEILKAIRETLYELKEKGVKAIIFRSQGGGPFSAGADLAYIDNSNWDKEKLLAYRNLGKELMNEITNFKIPTVAIVDGPAVGGGCELMLACDYRVFTDLGVIAMPEVGLGIIPDWGGVERLPAIVGKELAKRLICTAKLKNLGLKLGGEDCFRVGIADAFITQAYLPHLITDLTNGKGPVDIFTKPLKKANHDKKIEDYPAHIVSRFGLNKSFKHDWRWVTRYAARFAEDLIDHSDDLEYIKQVNTDEAFLKLVQSAKKVHKRYVSPMLAAAQSKFWAKIFEKLGILK